MNLLHFTVFGINPTNTIAGSAPTYQTLDDILNQKFISIDNLKFVNKNINFDGEKDVELNPVKLFSDSITRSPTSETLNDVDKFSIKLLKKTENLTNNETTEIVTKSHTGPNRVGPLRPIIG